MSYNPTTKSKILGQYFTLAYIVNYIIDQTLGLKLKCSKFEGQLPTLTILEPACGNGIFLVNALKVLFNHFKKFYKSRELMKLKRSIIANNLYSIDIDDESITVFFPQSHLNLSFVHCFQNICESISFRCLIML